MSPTKTLTGHQYEWFRNYLHSHTGISLGDGKQLLVEGRLGQRLRALKLDSFDQYLKHLKVDKGQVELGLFVNALTEDLLPVDLAGPGHDALAELIFDVSLDAEGFFTIDLGLGSVLADVDFGPIDFDVQPLTFEVVPEPAGVVVLAVLGLLTIGRGRNTSWSRRRVA